MKFTRLDNGVLRSADESASTNFITVLAGENLTAMDVVYISVGAADGGRTSGRAYKLDPTNNNRIEFVGVVTATATAGNNVVIQNSGEIDGFTGLSVGKPIYASVTTPGSYQSSAPNTSGQWMIQLGIASSATRLSINAAGSATAIKISSESEITDPDDINYMSNPNGLLDTSGWSTFNTTFVNGEPQTITAGSDKLSINRTTSNVLRSIAALQMDVTTASGSAGHGIISDEFTIDNADLAKRIIYSLDYNIVTNPSNVDTSGTSTHTIEMWVYNVGLGVWTQPSNFRGIDSKGIFSSAITEFQTDSSNLSNKNKYRVALILRNAPAGVFQMNFGNVRVGPQAKSYGALETNWNSYTPTVTSLGGTLTNFTAQGFWKRNGDTADYKIRLVFNGAPGTWSNPLFSLPSGQVVDNTKIPGGDIQSFRNASAGLAIDTGTQTYQLSAWPYTTTTLIAQSLFITGNVVNLNSLSQASPFTWVATDEMEFIITDIPILGWESNTIASSSADTRVVAFGATTSTTVHGSISNGAVTTCVFGTTVTDTHGGYNASTGEYTVKVPGWYNITGIVRPTGSFSSAVQYETMIYVNGTKIIGRVDELSGSAGNTMSPMVTLQGYRLNAGDVVTIRGVGSNWTSLTTASGAGLHYFSISQAQGPNQIAASEVIAVCAYRSATPQTVPNNTDTTIVFDTVETDTHGSYNASTGVFTAPAPGLYKIDAAVRLDLTIGTATATYAYVQKNGSGVRAQTYQYQDLTAADVSLRPTDLVRLNAGDTITVRASQFSTNSGATSATTFQTYLNIHRLGGVM